jgi:hypothetical protein
MDKWDLLLHNQRIKDFWFEDECRAYITELRNRWDGESRRSTHAHGSRPLRRVRRTRIQAVVLSRAQPNAAGQRTLENLARTDWAETPLVISMNPGGGSAGDQTGTLRAALRDLQNRLERSADHILFLADDLDLNRHIHHNLQQWKPLQAGRVGMAGLFNPGVRELACDSGNNLRVVDPRSVFGRPVFLVSRDVTAQLVRQWIKLADPEDLSFSHITSRSRKAIPYHAPSLVQHLDQPDERKPRFHRAIDFDPVWKA